MHLEPVIGVLALQGDVAEHVAMLHGIGVTAVTVRRRSKLARRVNPREPIIDFSG